LDRQWGQEHLGCGHWIIWIQEDKHIPLCGTAVFRIAKYFSYTKSMLNLVHNGTTILLLQHIVTVTHMH